MLRLPFLFGLLPLFYRLFFSRDLFLPFVEEHLAFFDIGMQLVHEGLRLLEHLIQFLAGLSVLCCDQSL